VKGGADDGDRDSADEDAAAFERSSNLSAASPPKIGPPAVDIRMLL